MYDVLDCVGILMTSLLRHMCEDPRATEPRPSDAHIQAELQDAVLTGFARRVFSRGTLDSEAMLSTEAPMREIVSANRKVPVPDSILNQLDDREFSLVLARRGFPYFVADVVYGSDMDSHRSVIDCMTNLRFFANSHCHPLNGVVLGIVLPVPYGESFTEVISQSFLEYVHANRRSWHMQVDAPWPMVSPFHYINHGRGDCVDWRTGDRVCGYCVGALVWQSPMEFCVDTLTNRLAGDHDD
jgi:hypothetical protein